MEDKEYNYNEEYEKRYVNRRLARMEEYFRNHHLLEKGEMLDVTATPQKHIRLPFIEYIAYRKGWIDGDEYLCIVTK